MRFMKKLLSAAVSLSLCAGLAAPAFAVTYDISKEDVTVSETGSSGWDVEKGDHADHSFDEEGGRDITITQSDSEKTSNTVTVDDNVKDVGITLKDVNIKADSGEDAVSVGEGADVDITLEGDNTLTSGASNVGLDVGKGAHVDLDLNGGTLDGGGKTAVKVQKDAELTVKDSSKDDTGKITGSGKTKDNAVVVNNGKLKVEDGMIDATGDGVGVFTKGFGDTTIGEEATVSGGNAKNGVGVQVEGGNAKLKTEGTIDGYYGVLNNGGTVTVDDGTVEGGYIGAYAANGGTVNVNGGTVHGDRLGISETGSKTTVNINGGTVSSDNNGVQVIKGSNLNVDGGKITGENIGIVADGKNTSVDMSGGSVTGKKVGLQVQTGAGADVSGGTITAYNPEGEASGIHVNGGSKVTVKERDPENNPVTISGRSDMPIVGEGAKAGAGITVFGNGVEDGTELVVEGGTITGSSFGISGNGSNKPGEKVYSGTKIDVKGGTIEGSIGIYHPQAGKLNVTGGDITGKFSGIEIRAGKLVVSGESTKITGNTERFDAKPYDNGATTIGAGISVVQHTTQLPIVVTIEGGTITGYTAMYEKNLQENENLDVTIAVDEVKLVSKGASVDSENELYFVIGGMASDPVLKPYLGKINLKNAEFDYNNKESDGQVYCILVNPVEGELPYQVGYLTGVGRDISLTVGETEGDPVTGTGGLVPHYCLNGRLVKGKDDDGNPVQGKYNDDDPSKLDSLIQEWSVREEDADVATVDENGIVTALSAGTATVIATLINGETVTFTVTVKAPTKPTEPSEPIEPSEPTEPSEPIEPDIPDAPAAEDDDDGDDDAAAPGTEIADEAVPLAGGPVTRAEFINYLWQRAGKPEGALCTFPDVSKDHQYVLALGWAQENGIAVAYLNAQGHEDGTFEPDELVTVGAAREFLEWFAAHAEMTMPEMTALTGPDEELLFTCDQVMKEFFGE